MTWLMAGAAILVATAFALSLLMALPAAAVAETAGEFHAASRARVWLASLILPPVVGIGASLLAYSLHGEGVAASPHIAGLRPHLCLLPLLNAPAGAFAMRAFGWLALLLMCVALIRLIATIIGSHLLRRMMLSSGVPLEEEAEDVLLVDLDRSVSFNAGLLRPVIVVSSSLRSSLDSAELAAIVAHERAHARRFDNLMRLVAEVCATVQALSPPAWYYRDRLREAQETAADDAAILMGVSPVVLKNALAVAGEATRSRPATPSIATLLIPAPALIDLRRRRLECISVEAETAASHPWRGMAAAVVGLVVVALLLIAARRPVDDTLFCAFEQLIAALN